MKRVRALGIAIVLATVVFPCSIDNSPRFIPGSRPEQADARFIKGELGVLTPYLSKRYELIAWRYLAGLPLSQEEQAATIAKPSADSTDDATVQWQKARPATAWLNRWKQSGIAQNEFYENCLDDAFATAAATLGDRRKAYKDDALVAQWAAAQDQVFSNCSGNKPVYPPDPDASLQGLARADRMYQIAAAHFYAEDLEGALQRFQAIAADTGSPWRAASEYMVARVLLRESVLLKRADGPSLARAQLVKVAADPDAGRFRNSAQQLIEYADSILNPAAVFAAVGKQFAAPHPGPDFANILTTANYLMQTDRFKKTFEGPDLPEPFDWVRAFESNDAADSVRRWKETHSDLWLVPALMKSDEKDAEVPALLEAANKVPESSPAYDTVTYHSIRLIAHSGKADTARSMLDRLLAGKPRALASVDNAFRGQRMQLATSFDDFLHWAPRKPIGIMEEDIGDDDKVNDAPVLDRDSIEILNRTTPLSRLAAAAESAQLPPWSAAEVARIGLTRAIVLGDDATAARLAPIVARAHPKWAGDLKTYTDAAGAEKRFLADLLIERQSALATDLYADFRQTEDLTDYQDWWCAEIVPDSSPGTLPGRILSDAELKEAALQNQRLNKAGPAQAFVAPAVMSWAKAHPNDPRVPEALGRVVRMTRYGCRGIPEINGPISKAAFDMLHQKYPASDWAKKTPYWFKD